MNVYLLRHGIAAPLAAENHYRDELRELTPEGQSKMRRAAQGMKCLGMTFDVVASSPLIRCRQTAEIVREALAIGTPLQIWNDLAPEGDIGSVLQRLQELEDHPSLLAVGHQPSIGCLAATLIAGNGKISLPFRKGSLWGINLPAGFSTQSGELELMLTSKMMRQIANL